MFVCFKLLGYEAVIERMTFIKLHAGTDNGTLHVNVGRLHFQANRVNGWAVQAEVLAAE